MAGGELGRRIMDLIARNYMVLNLDRDWLDKFRKRTDRGDTVNVYYGIGKVLDAGSPFARDAKSGDVELRAASGKVRVTGTRKRPLPWNRLSRSIPPTFDE